MSDLQLGLLAIGVAVVAGVIAYNRWQEARLRRRTEGAFAHGTTMPCSGAAARRPSRGSRPRGGGRAGPGRPHDRAHARRRWTAGAADRLRRRPHPWPQRASIPPSITSSSWPAHGRSPAPTSPGTPRRSSTKDWSGRCTGRATTKARALWRPVSPEARYARLRVGVQLTSRAGPLGDEDLLAFCGEVQEVALAIAAQADFPDTDEAVARAQELDRFCAGVDVQIGLSVIGSESHAFSGSKLRALAESAGMTIGRDGRFHRYAEDGTELFSLSNLEPMPFHAETMKTLQTRGVTALFDVPRVSASPSAFRRFIDFAHQLEQALGGVLVDDNRKPIGQAALEAIGQQLESIHRTMAARGIPAGGPLALRLFS